MTLELGGGNTRGNIIGNAFTNNIIGEYCYNNIFGDECYNNNLANFFVNNRLSNGFNNVTTVDLDSSGNFQNNNFTFGYFSNNLTLSGGLGGNPILYSDYTVNVMQDSQVGLGTTYVTFLSGGIFAVENIIVTPATPTPTPTETQVATPTPTPTETQPEPTPTPTETQPT